MAIKFASCTYEREQDILLETKSSTLKVWYIIRIVFLTVWISLDNMSLTWYYKPINSPRYQGFIPSLERAGRQQNSLPELKRQTTSARTPGHMTPTSGYTLGDKNNIPRISRPTVSSKYRTETPRLCFESQRRYISHDGHYVWSKARFLNDYYSCLYNAKGAVKKGTKI